MKKLFVCLSLVAVPAAAAMSRVVAVPDARTVVVETNGVTSAVHLRDVSILADEEQQAVRHLRSLIGGRWVYIEGGEVYRSPDGLYVNRELRRRAWLGYTYLGEVDPGAPRKVEVAKAPPPAKSPAKKTPPRPKRRPSPRK